jgi:hypothetical protein
MLQLFKKYHQRLTNLTAANRSLLLLKAYKSQFFDLHQLDFFDGKPSFQVIEDLIQNSDRINLLPEIDPRFGKSNELSVQLKQLCRADKTIMEERGAEELYLGYPFVYGKMLDGTPVRCPLAFFPVKLESRKNQWTLQLRESGGFLNRTFLLAYSHFNAVQIEEELLDTAFEESWENSRVFLTSLYELIKKSELQINFNASLFEQKLEAFQSFSRKDLENLPSGELKLYPQALLGIFPQTGSYISTDYDLLLNQNIFAQFESLEDIFGQRPQSSRILKEEHFRLPFPVDASQEAAIAQIKKGNSIVVQGPPGTGKSQLISNLMADFAAQGKRVLLVCQKRAAIDTVYQRLGEAGMHPFSALVHDFKKDRKALYDKIAAQIDRILSYKHENQSLNAVFLEREFDAAGRKTDQLVREFSTLKSSLYDKSNFGISAKELYLLARHQTEKELDLSDIYSSFHFSTLDEFLQKLDQLESYRDHLHLENPAAEFWQNRNSFAEYPAAYLQQLKGIITVLASTKKKLNDLCVPFTLDIEAGLDLLLTYRQRTASNEHFVFFQEAVLNPAKKQRIEQFRDLLADLNEDVFTRAILALDRPEDKKRQLEQAITACSSFFGRFSWKLFSKRKKEVFRITNELGLHSDIRNLDEAKLRIDTVLLVRNIMHETGFNHPGISLDDLKKGVQTQLDLSWLAVQITSITNQPLLKSETTKAFFDDKIENWISCYQIIRQNKNDWQQFLTENQIQGVNSENLGSILSYLQDEFDNLVARDALYESLSGAEKKAYLTTSEKFADKYSHYFKQNLILHMIYDLEEKFPELRLVSSLQLEMKEEELQRSIQKKQRISREYLLMRLRENTYRNIEKNRLGNPTTYRDLKHQTTKKREIWPVRKLVESLSHEIFDLIPCWMASPETVSAIFPLNAEPLFDLVIFDEASQCFAEKGLPAMLRGQTLLVAGDSKQLQPNDLYSIRPLDTTTEENTLLEAESLLEMASQILPQHTLKGHYRSKSLDLIDFSNRHFYKNELTLLPDFEDINEGNPAINYIKIDGQWKDNQNTKEAERILELVTLLRTSGNTKSIGIVTFNFAQAELIRDIIEPDYPDVTVKNIENIQGDEYDIVIFSVGYAPDESGKVKATFGSLNQKGGENRLNVAITRSREQIFIVCSFSPEQLTVTNSTNSGPELLKLYLEYARDVSEGNYKPSLKTDLKKGWVMYLKDEIATEYPVFKNELPFADLTEKRDGYYRSLLLTDDELFYSSDSLKESFAYIPSTLKSKGWKYTRAWSRNWWINPEKLVLSVEKQEKG